MRNGGQLSFFIKAGSDILPTPMNLCHMHIQHGSQCPLSSSVRPTMTHILSDLLKDVGTTNCSHKYSYRS